MPVLFNVATQLIFGGLAAFFMRRSRALREHWTSWQLVLITAVEALIYTPFATFWFRFHPHWSLLYSIDPQRHPNFEVWVGPLSALCVAANFVALVGAFIVGREGLMREKLWLATLPLTLGGVVWLAGLIAFYDRAFLLADYDRFWQGEATFVLRHFTGWSSLAAHCAAIGTVGWFYRRFATHDPSWV